MSEPDWFRIRTERVAKLLEVPPDYINNMKATVVGRLATMMDKAEAYDKLANTLLAYEAAQKQKKSQTVCEYP